MTEHFSAVRRVNFSSTHRIIDSYTRKMVKLPDKYKSVQPSLPTATKTINNYKIASQFSDVVFTFKSFPSKSGIRDRKQ